jgi:hypothetical protein
LPQSSLSTTDTDRCICYLNDGIERHRQNQPPDDRDPSIISTRRSQSLEALDPILPRLEGDGFLVREIRIPLRLCCPQPTRRSRAVIPPNGPRVIIVVNSRRLERAIASSWVATIILERIKSERVCDEQPCGTRFFVRLPGEKLPVP